MSPVDGATLPRSSRSARGTVSVGPVPPGTPLVPPPATRIAPSVTVARATDPAPIAARIRPTSGAPAIRRMISSITVKDDQVSATTDGHRPPGTVKDSQGDHTTPFVMLQHEIVNAIKGTDLDGAWDNLRYTFDNVYQQLPGWADSSARVRNGVADYQGMHWNVGDMLTARGDQDQLLATANAMLALRNQIAHSGIKGGGTGHNEAGLAGGLDHYEQQARKGNDTGLERDAVIYNMCMAFDHGRNDQRTSADLLDKTWQQHCQTVVSAHPSLAETFMISADDLSGRRAEFSRRWHDKYG